MAKLKDYYRTLGIKPDADDKTIKSAYRKLAKTHHPDRHGGSKEQEEKFKEIQEAYETLRDIQKRKQYDAQRLVQSYTSESLNDAFEVFPFDYYFEDWDEVIADNYSVSHVSHPEDLDIILSPAEAKNGGILPIDLPAYFGFGFWTSPYSRHTFTLHIPAGVKDGATQEMYIAEYDLWLRVCYRVKKR